MTDQHNTLPEPHSMTHEAGSLGVHALHDVQVDLGGDASHTPSPSVPTAEQFPKGTIKAVWETKDGSESPTLLTLYIPEVDEIGTGAFFCAELIDYEQMGKTLRAGTLGVDRELRGAGYGKRLVEALGYEGVEQGCDEIEVDLSHAASLKHFMAVYGPDRVQLYGDNEKVSWDMQEAITEINDRRASSAQVVTPDGRSHVDLDRVGVRAVIDLEGLDTTGWESRIAQDADQAPWNA